MLSHKLFQARRRRPVQHGPVRRLQLVLLPLPLPALSPAAWPTGPATTVCSTGLWCIAGLGAAAAGTEDVVPVVMWGAVAGPEVMAVMLVVPAVAGAAPLRFRVSAMASAAWDTNSPVVAATVEARKPASE